MIKSTKKNIKTDVIYNKHKTKTMAYPRQHTVVQQKQNNNDTFDYDFFSVCVSCRLSVFIW